jgi:hypothetical protein
MSEPLLPPRFLFRFAAPCLTRKPLWAANGAGLDERYRLLDCAQLDGAKPFAEVRTAWSEQGLALAVRVEGKRQAPWCRESRPDDSDGLRVWIDTRDTHNIHRASRFCHQFIFMPAGTGRGLDEPVAEQLLINRAKENARPVRPGVLQVRREKRVDGYVLEGFIPAVALTGFDPQENPRLGFTYAVVDRELGEQTWSCPGEFPYREDPSLWGTLELVAE